MLFFKDTKIDSASCISSLYFKSASKSALSNAFLLSAIVKASPFMMGSVKTKELERLDKGDALATL